MADRRLLEGEATDRERTLLEAALDDVPSDGRGRQRTLAALGLGVGVGTVSTTAAAAVSGKVAATTKAASFIGKVTTVTWAKIVVTTVGTTMALGTAAIGVRAIGAHATVAASSSSHEGAPARGAPPTKAAPALRGLHLPPVPPVGSETAGAAPSEPTQPPHAGGIEATALPALGTAGGEARTDGAAPAANTTPPRQRGVTTDVATARELAEQVAALDRARSALDGGRAAESLDLLDGFDRRFARSPLHPEATVLRVRALLAAGRRDEAVALVRQDIRRGGARAYRNRLAALVGLDDRQP